MSRIKIALPEKFQFAVVIPIRITDLNYGGHVGNDTILSLIHEARACFLNQAGYTEMDCGGVSLIMSDAGIEFKAELFYGDAVKAYVAAGNFSRVGLDFFYKLVKGSDETILALAKTGMVCFDYSNKKVVSVPEKAKALLAV
jgi:acyl-CoA thioester hydrolase